MAEAVAMVSGSLISRFTAGASRRLLVAASLGVAVAIAVPDKFGLALRILAGWDMAAVALSAAGWAIIVRSSAADTKAHAAADDPGRTLVWLVVLLASTVSLFATAAVLRRADALAPSARDAFVVLCIAAVATAWFLTHTAYTLRYAHLYYRDGDEGGGLLFAGDLPPDYFDFGYFAFTIGMCFQVSDVAVSNRALRRAVLVHSIISFA
ncbi:MAG: DUF1345 domain-containing protein, partial [Myxococcales bacterium]